MEVSPIPEWQRGKQPLSESVPESSAVHAPPMIVAVDGVATSKVSVNVIIGPLPRKSNGFAAIQLE
jgi:hypothetical protein